MSAERKLMKDELIEQKKFLNRELNWLEFNQRVLEEAYNLKVPLLDRLKFLAITSSNLDEFFMVRVGGLKLLQESKITTGKIQDFDLTEQIRKISQRAHKMVEDQYQYFLNEVDPLLASSGIKRILSPSLNEEQFRYIENYFDNEIFPLVTPHVVSTQEKLPLLNNCSLYLAIRVKSQETAPEDQRTVFLPLGHKLTRFITLPSNGQYEYILVDDLIAIFIDRFFPGESVLECVPFRITRNADMSVEEDFAADFLAEMKEVIRARKSSGCVRLEIKSNATKKIITFFKRILKIKDEDIYSINGPIDLSEFMTIANLEGYKELKNKPWPPQISPAVSPTESMFNILSNKDILLYHPYESYEPVVRMIVEAAEDPDVLAIKQILYRTGKNSQIINALRKAAENGKYVTVIVELKARFDEEKNIEWAEILEQSGVQVIYGIKGLKTHAKICIILRREPRGIVRYMHFGTGNYNEITAKLYSDASFMTCDDDIGKEATNFFNTITGRSLPHRYQKLEAAPFRLREKFLNLIESEIERKKQGQRAHIMAKVNALVDHKIIEALYAASNAGVRIDLNVRGICCLRPGVPKLSENIAVISVIDRFLEHSRIFYFHQGGEKRVFIASADWMPRNLDRRIELLVPIDSPPLADRLISILNTYFKDTEKAWELQSDGQYRRTSKGKGAKKRYSSQKELYRQARKSFKNIQSSKPIVFEPYLAPTIENK